jgi:hypothetical protein
MNSVIVRPMNEIRTFNVPTWIALVALCAMACDRPAQPASTSASSPAATAPPPEPSPPRAELPSGGAPSAAPAEPSASPSGSATAVTFDAEQTGAPSPSFEGVVGDWYVAEAGGAHGLMVDGGRWRNGTPSANLADQAKRLYGDRYAQFLDGVKAFAFFPFAVWNSDPPRGDLRISVRFYPLAGKIDQAAGVAFAIAPDGTYLGIRANALEDNMLYFRVVKGKRTVIDDIRNVPTPTKTWHTLSVEIRGRKVTAVVDGQKRFEKTLDAAPTGRIGLWSKADSQVLFDDFKVEPLGGTRGDE